MVMVNVDGSSQSAESQPKLVSGVSFR